MWALIGNNAIEEVLTDYNPYSIKNAKEKTKMKTNMYHVDHVLMKELASLIKTEIEQEEKKQIEIENNITSKNE